MNIHFKKGTMIKNFFFLSLLTFCVSNPMEAHRYVQQLRFADAVKKDSLEEAKKIWTEGGIDINGSITFETYSIHSALGGFDVTKATYLYKAVEKSVALVQFLLDCGVDVNKVVEGNCPLAHAIYLKNETIVRLLLENGALPSPAILDFVKQQRHELISLIEAFQKSRHP